MKSDQGIKPSYFGFVESRDDALILIEACLRGSLSLIDRRPTSSERPSVAQSGQVFIYEEKTSGIQRWTDGRKWSPSRVLGEFLIYGERSASAEQSHTPRDGTQPRLVGEDSEDRNRSLYGPLTGSLRVNAQSLVKKIIKVQPSDDSDATWHVVSYYRSVDVVQRCLQTPSMKCILQAWHLPVIPIPSANQSDDPVTRLCGMSLQIGTAYRPPNTMSGQAGPCGKTLDNIIPGAGLDPIPDLGMTDSTAVPWCDYQQDPNLVGYRMLISENDSTRSRLHSNLYGQNMTIGGQRYMEGHWI